MLYKYEKPKKRCGGQKQTPAQVQKQIERLIRKYQILLSLDRWIITRHYGPLMASTEDLVCFAEIEPSWEYRDADVSFDVDAIIEYRMGPVLEYIVRHELSHCVTEPVADTLRKLMDLFTTKLMEYETSHIERLSVWDKLDEKGE